MATIREFLRCVITIMQLETKTIYLHIPHMQHTGYALNLQTLERTFHFSVNVFSWLHQFVVFVGCE